MDVGCGDGSLIAYLDDGSKRLTGIDINELCIAKANLEDNAANTRFICCGFDTYEANHTYDAIIFVASLHHMDMTAAIEKSKELLSPNGVLIIVGLASPSSAIDYVIEGLRVLPCKIVSRFKHMQSSESQNIPVSYCVPSLNEVRDIANRLLPHASMNYGLFYRYLLMWCNC